jgi:hypothetical protein
VAQVFEGEIEPTADHLMDDVRDADAAGRGEALESHRDVDAIAVDIVVVNDHIAKVDADPDLDAVPRLEAGIVLGDVPLDLDRAVDGVDDAGELDQGAIAGELDNAAAMIGDLGFGDVLA